MYEVMSVFIRITFHDKITVLFVLCGEKYCFGKEDKK